MLSESSGSKLAAKSQRQPKLRTLIGNIMTVSNLSPLALIAVIQDNNTIVHRIKFEGVSASRLLLVNKAHKKCFLLITTSECEEGPGCETCQSRVSVAKEDGYKLYSHPKSEHVFAEIEYSEDLFSKTPNFETLLSTKMPFIVERLEKSWEKVYVEDRFASWWNRLF